MPFPFDPEQPKEKPSEIKAKENTTPTETPISEAKANNRSGEQMESSKGITPSSADATKDTGALIQEQKNDTSEPPALTREARRKQLLEVEKGQGQRQEAQKEIQEEEENQSREAIRKKERRERKRLKVRVVPIWLRLFILLILCAVALAGGAMVGYGVIGKGNPMAVFNMHTWTHIRDVVYAKK